MVPALLPYFVEDVVDLGIVWYSDVKVTSIRINHLVKDEICRHIAGRRYWWGCSYHNRR